MSTFDPPEDPPVGDAEAATPPPEPSLEARIARVVSAESRRYSGKWDRNGDHQAHDVEVKFQRDRVILLFTCLGSGGNRARFAQVNLTPAAIERLGEWAVRHKAERAQQKVANRRLTIQRALAALADNQLLFAEVRDLLESYEQALEDTVHEP